MNSNAWIHTLVVGLVGHAVPVLAQTTAPAGNELGGLTVEEVVVTAQRRSERLQDVPLSISALTSDALENKGVSDAQALTSVVPGLQFGSQGPAGTPFIRGVGAVLGNPSDEPSVATYVDGVYIAAPFANYTAFNNIERIEVLKGPQGTLFGRNATGGVIQVITPDPSQTPSAKMRIGYANYQTMSSSVYGTTGITDDLAIDLAAQIEDQGEGWGRNRFLNRDVLKKKEYSFRSKVLFTPTDATEIRLAGDYSRIQTAGLNFELTKGLPAPDGVINTLADYDSRSGLREIVDQKSFGGSLRIDQDFGAVRLASITAYREANGRDLFDNDTVEVDLLSPDLSLDQRNWSQEFHLLSPESAPFNWLLGAYFFDGDGAYDPAVLQGLVVAPPPNFLAVYGRQFTRSTSIFGQATFNLAEDLKLTTGLRYTKEKQKLIQVFAPNGTFTPEFVQRQDFDDPTWRLALDYELAPDVLAYISYNRGIKSGGWDALSPPNTLGYKPEVLDAYEIGLKTELFDRTMRLNTAAFWYDYKDLQVSNQSQGVSVTSNAASARIMGLEAEVDVRVSQNLSLNANVAYTDGEYRDYPNALGYFPIAGLGFIVDAAGNRTLRTPKFTGNVGVDYSIPVATGEIMLSVSGSYTSKFFWTAQNRHLQDDYSLVNASVQWLSSDGTFSARLWGKNLGSTDYATSGVSSGFGDFIIRGAPQTYGITLGVSF